MSRVYALCTGGERVPTFDELAYILKWHIHPVTGPIGAFFARRYYSGATFSFLGAVHEYYVHHYHNTWTTERAVEIPIALQYLSRIRKGAVVLEVGNVLSHYPDGLRLMSQFQYTVVDKYEQAPGVVNEDVVDFTSPKPVDFILSISTLEHVGLDEGGSATKWRMAITRLLGSLAKDGKMMVTMPIGYNHDVDQCMRDGKLPFDEVHYLKRISVDNRWREASLDEAMWARFNFPYLAGNAIIVGFLEAPS